jgi:hypothetical protein
VSAVPCPECGAPGEDGARSCKARFDELLARDFSDVRYGRVHRLMVDAYALQHPDAYCRSARSLAAHLGGLCVAFEYDGQRVVHEALRRWIESAALVKPGLPAARGVVTIAEAFRAGDPLVYQEAVHRWAKSVWDAHAGVHEIARGWLRQALAMPRRHAR